MKHRVRETTLTDNPFQKYELLRRPNNLLKLHYHISRFPHLTYLGKKYIGAPLLSGPETRLNRSLRSAFYYTGADLMPPEDIAAHRHLTREMTDYVDAIMNSDRIGKPVVWTQWNYSNEILWAFDVLKFVPETLCAIVNLLGSDYGVRIMEAAEAEGVSKEHCSSARYSVGTYLLDQAPKPDLILTTSHPCDTNVSVYQTLQYLTGAPMFAMDSPYWDDDDAFRYYEKNLWELVRFLETRLKQKPDWDRLKTACELINQTYACLNELSDMSRAAPSPVPYQPMLYSWLGGVTSIGSPGAAEFARITCENARKRLEQGRGFLKNEKIRMIWFDVPIGFHFINPWLEKEFGAIAVADFMARTQRTPIDTSSEKTMVRDIAVNSLHVSMARNTRGPIELYTDEFERIIRQYNGHCLIFTRHDGCKHGWAALKIKKDICRESGLPALLLHADIFDPRILPEEQMKREFREFFTTNGLA